ncbi:Cyclic beta-1,2-glucan modification transmembrane protein [Pseudomonas sp. R1-43-08]|uniref:LTA synthase family protein n=1 Tax=Pseudomonas sp. R1-43-08 TaxID=1173270 RepID=UPI000F567C00|nr:LTA synthase family protein [Pseudomonas sp. R1-43-08]AZF41745.1 Cyclic beta-1,2-glucan modification transmembrane protein [Pseudomonas sp. R1-43-08]
MSKIAKLCCSTLRFLRETFIYFSFSTLLVCLVEYCSGLNLLTINFLQVSMREAGMTILVMTSIFIILDALLRRRYFSMLPISLPLILIALISRQKLGYLSEPLYPWDFIFADQVYKLLPELAKEKSNLAVAWFLGGLILALITVWAISVVYQKQRRKPPRRALIASSCLMLLATVICTSTTLGQKWVQDVLKVQAMPWAQVENYRQNGFLLAFLMNMESALVDHPTMPIEIALKEIGKPAAEQNADTISDTGQKPDIIIIMSEAFWDPTRLPGIHSMPDPMPTIRALSTGDIFSPSQGGNTANVEFELLTGFSNAFLPAGSVPYQQYIYRNIPSIIWTLKAHGYKTIAIHPYYKHFWNRDNVYKYLGFEHFMGLENMPGLPSLGPFVSDSALMDRLYETLEATTEPKVVFAVTMQNHGPYEKDRYAQPNIYIQMDKKINENDAVQTYGQGIYDSDRALTTLMGKLSLRARPSLLVFFGDHTPYLGANLAAYRQTGLITSPSTERLNKNEYLQLRKTPLILWSSITGAKGAKSGIIISPSMLPSLILKELNFHHPFYSGLLNKIREAIPVIDRRMILNKNGSWIENWRKDEGNLLQKYHTIQYDMIFGNQKSQKFLFEDMPNNEEQP